MSCSKLVDFRCSLGLHGGSPSPGVCATCPSYEGSPRGAGDVVHAIASATGIERIVGLIGGCSACLERRIRLNEAIPFSDERREQ